LGCVDLSEYAKVKIIKAKEKQRMSVRMPKEIVKNMNFKERLKIKNLLMLIVISILFLIGSSVLYSEVTRVSKYIGIIGYTLAPGGGGLGDYLTLYPVEPSWLIRVPGSDFSFGPYDKARLLISVRVVPILASFIDTYVNVTVTVNEESIFLGRVLVPGDGKQHTFDLRVENQSLYIPAGSKGYLHIIADPPHIEGMGKPIFINTESYVWLEFLEAPYDLPPTFIDFLKTYGIAFLGILLPLLLPKIWNFIVMTDEEMYRKEILKLLEEIRNLLGQRLVSEEEGDPNHKRRLD